MLTFMGLILRENDRGETSKSVTVLTAERGVIDIFVRGGRKSTKNASSTQLFAYSKLCVDEKKNAKDQSMFFLCSYIHEKLRKVRGRSRFLRVEPDVVKKLL